MKNWAEDVLHSRGFMDFFGGWALATVMLYLLLCLCFFGLHIAMWVLSGEWSSNGWPVFSRISILALVSFIIPTSIIIAMATISKIIGRYNKKVEEHNSKLAEIEN